MKNPILLFAFILLTATFSWGQRVVPEVVIQEGNFSEILSLNLSADGTKVAGVVKGSTGPKMVVWEVRSGNMIIQLDIDQYANRRDLDISADGRYVALLQDRNVIVWDLEQGTRGEVDNYKKVIPIKKDGIPQTLAFSPDGQYLVVGAKSIHLLKIDPHRTMWEDFILGTHNRPVTDFFFNGDGTILATGSKDKMVKIWNIPQRVQTRFFQDFKKQVTDICLSHDGKTLATCDSKFNVQIWDLGQTRLLREFREESGIKNMQMTPDGKKLVWKKRKSQRHFHLRYCLRQDGPATGRQ